MKTGLKNPMLVVRDKLTNCASVTEKNDACNVPVSFPFCPSFCQLLLLHPTARELPSLVRTSLPHLQLTNNLRLDAAADLGKE